MSRVPASDAGRGQHGPGDNRCRDRSRAAHEWAGRLGFRRRLGIDRYWPLRFSASRDAVIARTASRSVSAGVRGRIGGVSHPLDV